MMNSRASTDSDDVHTAVHGGGRDHILRRVQGPALGQIVGRRSRPALGGEELNFAEPSDDDVSLGGGSLYDVDLEQGLRRLRTGWRPRHAVPSGLGSRDTVVCGLLP
jgi:hypothetical protein